MGAGFSGGFEKIGGLEGSGIYEIDLKTGNTTNLFDASEHGQSIKIGRLTPAYNFGGYDLYGLTVSPDPKRIAFITSKGELEVWDTATHEVTPLLDPQTDAVTLGLAWAPSGERIVLSKRHKTTGTVVLSVVDLSDKSVRDIKEFPGEKGGGSVKVLPRVWTAGDTIVFTYDSSARMASPEEHRLSSIGLDGTDVRELDSSTTPIVSFAW